MLDICCGEQRKPTVSETLHERVLTRHEAQRDCKMGVPAQGSKCEH